MNVLGKRVRDDEIPDPLVIGEVDAHLVRAKRVCIGVAPDVYCLPEDAPVAAGDVIVSNGDGTSSWTGVAPLANVVQRHTLYALTYPWELNEFLSKSALPLAPQNFNGVWQIGALPAILQPELNFRYDDGGVTSNVFGLVTAGINDGPDIYGDFQMAGNNLATTGVTCIGFLFGDLPDIAAELFRVFVEIECNVGAFFNCDVDVFVTPVWSGLPEHGALATNDFEVFRASNPSTVGHLSDDMIYRDQARKSQQAQQASGKMVSMVRVELAETLVRKLIADSGTPHQVVFQFRTPNPNPYGHLHAVASWTPVVHRVAVTYERTTGSALGTVLPEDQINHDSIANSGLTSHADLDIFKSEVESHLAVAGHGGSLIIDRSDLVTALPVIGQFEVLNTDAGTAVQELNLQGFTSNAEKTHLTASVAGRYLVVASGSLLMDGSGGSVQCAVAIFVNAARVCEVAQQVDDSAVYPQACSTQAVVSLNVGDAISMQLRNLTSANGVNVTDASLTVVAMF
jgi:hypothetical protein